MAPFEDAMFWIDINAYDISRKIGYVASLETGDIGVGGMRKTRHKHIGRHHFRRGLCRWASQNQQNRKAITFLGSGGGFISAIPDAIHSSSPTRHKYFRFQGQGVIARCGFKREYKERFADNKSMELDLKEKGPYYEMATVNKVENYRVIEKKTHYEIAMTCHIYH
ncbi:unnamed protein product [Lactuca saligna]|uniref:Uncharacterized protein n=1 Tax=Lactuca saligna TaxID=75948 RepID=A0AA36EKD5_LACSI|nr:unnamed protein product [Lactuca saligna]